MNANEARARTRDLDKLTFFETLREKHLYKKINKCIIRAARKGKTEITVPLYDQFYARIYERIRKHYINLGYDAWNWDGYFCTDDYGRKHDHVIFMNVDWKGVKKDA